MKSLEKQNGYKPAIVIPAFRRPHALKRLLNSVAVAHYPDESVNIILSLEYGSDEEVIKIAERFQFPSGNVNVIRQEQHLGLRNHIVKCGDLTQEYGSVIILEEDLIVDPWFYVYAQKALNEYKEEPRVGGIALYAPEFNEFADLPFEPLKSDLDTYFMKIGCSSGQAWSDIHWKAFKKWYSITDSLQIREDYRLPDWVRFLWKESSWKKYYSGWLVDKDLYMVYPYISYTSNCSDSGGTHLFGSTALQQVKFRHPSRESDPFKFSAFDEHAIKYDSFMEICGGLKNLIDGISIESSDVEVDLYGTKSIELLQKKEWSVTSKPVYKAEATFPLAYRPLELNLIHKGDKASEPFFSYSRSIDIKPAKRLSRRRYFALAQYFMRFTPFKSRFFRGVLSGYLKELIRHLSGRKI